MLKEVKTARCIIFTDMPRTFFPSTNNFLECFLLHILFLPLTLRLLISYIYGAPSKARNANIVYIWTYVW